MDKLNNKTKIIFVGSIVLFLVLITFIITKFTVKPNSTVEKKVESISITDNSSNFFIINDTLTIPIGTNYLLSVDRIPNTATQRIVLNFKSDNENVASVNEFGLIQTKSIGEATITITSSDNPNLTDEIKLKVVDISINVKKISLSSTKLEINQDDTFLLETTIEPSNATNKSLVWKSSKPEIASVDNFGNIIGNAVGKSIISATSSNGVTVSCEVTVSQPGTIAESVNIDEKYTEIEKGKAVTLLANINPRDAKNNQITWSSNNEDIIKVDSNGIATGLQLGSAIITAKTSNLKTDSLTMTVVDPEIIAKTSSAYANKVIYPSSLNLSSSEINLFPGEKEKVKLTVEPENATNKNIILSNDRSGTVAISGNNDEVEITAQKPGEVDLVFSSMNGKTATLRVKVNDDPNVVSNISLSSSSVNLYVGDKQQITAIVEPSTAENQTLEWSSSNNNVASVENDGTITGINAGSADITVKTTNNKTSTVRVIVNNNTSETNDEDTSSDDSIDYGDDNSDTEDYDDNSDNNDDSEEDHSSNNDGDITEEDAPDEEDTTPDILAQSISFDTNNLILAINETKQVSVLFAPQDVDDKSLTWTSSDTNIATVDDDGLITAKSIGQATIKAVTDNNIETNLSVTVSGTVTPIIFIPTVAPTPTDGIDSVIRPPAGADIVKSDNSSTLITSIEKQKKYYITRVWVKDPTTQIRKAVTAGWGSYMQTLPNMAGNEISKKGLGGKIMVGINGSAWHSPGVDNYPAYNYTSLGTMALLDGEFLRNDYGNTGYKYPDIYYYGLDGNGDLQGYHSKKTNLAILYKTIVNAGVKNTFTFFNYPPIVINSKLFITDNGGKKASRTAFCQINNNNFILFTTRSKMTIKQIATVLKSLRCKTAVNLDGGSSIGLIYKSKGSSNVEVIRYAKRKVADMLYVTE